MTGTKDAPSANTLDLRNLTSEARNAATDEAVAQLVPFTQRHGWEKRVSGKHLLGLKCPPYATSADAVMPLLEKHSSYYVKYFKGDGYLCSINLEPHGMASALHSTEALAKCIALLRAHGVKVLT